MREILFKAKRTDNGEWVQGYLVENTYTDYRSFIVTSACWEVENEKSSDFIETDVYEIDPETICQYTGLTDKNGKKIWENDIVDAYEEYPAEVSKNVVKFKDGCFKLFEKDNLIIHLDGYNESELEVIGNIFDTPELLKETNTSEKILEEVEEAIEEAMIQEDAPIYCGSMEVDGYIRASVVKDIIRRYIMSLQ